MKRGFLNKPPKSSAQAEPKASDLAECKAQTSQKTDTSPVQIPTIAEPLPKPSRAITFPPRSFNFNMVSFPLVKSRPEEPVMLCLLYPEAREKLLAIPGFPTPFIPPPAYYLLPQKPYEIRSAPGMGTAMFASVALQPGDLILQERPIFLIPLAFPAVAMTTAEQVIEKLLENLSPLNRMEFYQLHNCKGKELSRLRGIMDTNCLSVGALPGPYQGTNAVVCRDLSRINHSCAPNAEHKWDLSSMTFSVRAVRPIQLGEQISITYEYTFQSRAERQSTLKKKYSFTCVCSSCTLQAKESARSDIRRAILDVASSQVTETIRTQDAAIKNWATHPTAVEDQITKRSRRVLDYMEEEGIYDEHLFSAHSAWLCKVYSVLRNRDAVVKLAKRAAVVSTVYSGNDGGWNKVATAPERSEWWGWGPRRG